MSCIHLGEKVGSLVTQCCGGKEKLVDAYACHHVAAPSTVTIPNRGESGMASVEIGGERLIRSVSGCVGCPFAENQVAVPSFQAEAPRTLAKQMWEDLRARRRRNRQQIEPFIECFTSFMDHGERPIHTKHLLYHIWPKRGGDWMRPLRAIEDRVSLFNGRKVVAVAMDDHADESVKDHLGWADEIVEVKNDPRLREVVSFVPLMSRVSEYGAGHATFLCHSKGVRHEENPHSTVHQWSDLMLEVLLDHWDYVHALLAEHPIVGALKKVGKFLSPTSAEWHYTGTYYWIANEDAFQRDWKKIDQVWWGTESWPGVHYKVEEAGCALLSGSAATLNMYDMRMYLEQIVPRLELFRRFMKDYRR